MKARAWAVNRNKRGIVLNLKVTGQEIVRSLVHADDILVENYRPECWTRLAWATKT